MLLWIAFLPPPQISVSSPVWRLNNHHKYCKIQMNFFWFLFLALGFGFTVTLVQAIWDQSFPTYGTQSSIKQFVFRNVQQWLYVRDVCETRTRDGSICLSDWVRVCWWWSVGWCVSHPEGVWKTSTDSQRTAVDVELLAFSLQIQWTVQGWVLSRGWPRAGRGSVVSCGGRFSCMTSDHGMPSCKSFLCIEQAQCLESAWASPPQPEETWLFSPTHLQTMWSPCGEDAVYVKETDN